jgi:Nucleotidyltransferase of unknown function (DUF6036)
MRQPVDRERLERLIAALGREGRTVARVYFTGGATALLLGWRESTIDVDLRVEPDNDPLLRALPGIKEKLEINLELAAPSDFIPELPGWRERCRFIVQQGRLAFLHYDLYSQALAKIERGHGRDLDDVRAMIDRGLVEPNQLLHLFEQIEPLLYRFPAIDAPTFRGAVEEIARPERRP